MLITWPWCTLLINHKFFGRIARWLLLFLKYDLKIVYKHGRSHLMAHALSRLPNQAKQVGVLDQTNDAHVENSSSTS